MSTDSVNADYCRGHDNNYKPLIEFLKSYNFVIAFEQSYEWGDKHIIAKKSS